MGETGKRVAYRECTTQNAARHENKMYGQFDSSPVCSFHDGGNACIDHRWRRREGGVHPKQREDVRTTHMRLIGKSSGDAWPKVQKGVACEDMYRLGSSLDAFTRSDF